MWSQPCQLVLSRCKITCISYLTWISPDSKRETCVVVFAAFANLLLCSVCRLHSLPRGRTQKRLAQYEIVFICVCQQTTRKHINKGAYTFSSLFQPSAATKKKFVDTQNQQSLFWPRLCILFFFLNAFLSFGLNNVFRLQACGSGGEKVLAGLKNAPGLSWQAAVVICHVSSQLLSSVIMKCKTWQNFCLLNAQSSAAEREKRTTKRAAHRRI